MSHRFQLSQFLVVLSASLAFAGAATGDPALPDLQYRVNVEQLMQGIESKAQITAMAGKPEFRCIASSPTTELCEWRLGNRDPGWRALAEAIDTGDRVALLCELPVSGGARAVDACSAHPRRSNRGEFPLNTRRAGTKRQATAAQTARRRDGYQRTARAWFAASPTLTDVSRLMGATPDQCVPTEAGLETCVWKTSSRVYGQGTAAILIDGPLSKKIRLTCVFPTSGGPRDEECTAEVGA